MRRLERPTFAVVDDEQVLVVANQEAGGVADEAGGRQRVVQRDLSQQTSFSVPDFHGPVSTANHN